jgi:hypothetical protein
MSHLIAKRPCFWKTSITIFLGRAFLKIGETVAQLIFLGE